jgi:hypothetical protein
MLALETKTNRAANPLHNDIRHIPTRYLLTTPRVGESGTLQLLNQ